MGVEILIQDLCGLFAEVTPLASDDTQKGDECWRKKWLFFGHNYILVYKSQFLFTA